MTVTVTDLFCGAGGSSLGARHAGATLVMAANHWQTAIDVHQTHFPDAGHDCADISQADPRRYPRTDILIASPECTNHSQARGVSRKRQDPTLWDAPDPAAERSRATMWDVVRFAEQMHYAAIVVENVVEASKWVLFPAWWQAMTDLGYRGRVLSHNSMHHGVPQSRDRIYVVWVRDGLHPDLEFEVEGWCARCSARRPARQAWKNGRTAGRHGQQWVWGCTTCGREVEAETVPAATIIDWELPTPRIGDRGVTDCPSCGRNPCGRHWKPLAEATRQRIAAGLARHGWMPVTTSGAGNVFERVPGNRSRPVSAPLATQQTTATTAVATPPDSVLFQPAHGGRTRTLDEPHPTVCGSDDRHALVVTNRRHHVPRSAVDPLTTVCAGGNHHGLLVRSFGNEGGDPGRHVTSTDEPVRTLTASKSQWLLMRNNGGGAEMVTPVEEPARTVTSKGHQSLLVPYNGRGAAKHVAEPLGTQPTKDRWALLDPDVVVDECGFRMLEPYEIAAAMAFPDGYIPRDLPKVHQVKLAGNAVTPPVMEWILGRIIREIEAR